MARSRQPLKVESLARKVAGTRARGVVWTRAARLKGIQPIGYGSWARR